MTDKLLSTRDALLRSIPACEHHGDQCVPHAMELVRNSIRARDVLAELVALNDIKDRLDATRFSAGAYLPALPIEQREALRAEYERRKPPAWAAARELLGPND